MQGGTTTMKTATTETTRMWDEDEDEDNER